MSKKDFIALAEYLTDESIKMYCTSIDGKFSVTMLREHLANFCHSRNPNFKRERWLDYIAGNCGPNGGSIRK